MALESWNRKEGTESTHAGIEARKSSAAAWREMERNSLNFCKAIKQLPSSVIEREKINLRKTSTAKTQ